MEKNWKNLCLNLQEEVKTLRAELGAKDAAVNRYLIWHKELLDNELVHSRVTIDKLQHQVASMIGDIVRNKPS